MQITSPHLDQILKEITERRYMNEAAASGSYLPDGRKLVHYNVAQCVNDNIRLLAALDFAAGRLACIAHFETPDPLHCRDCRNISEIASILRGDE